MSASGNRVLLQIMKHREQARIVRSKGDRDGFGTRPFSAVSLYDIGSPLRVSEPGSVPTEPKSRPRPHTSSAVSPPREDDRQGAGHECTADDGPVVATEPPAEASKPISRRPPSPYRRTPMTDDAVELKRLIAQLQSRLLSVETLLQQSNAQKRILAVKLRKYRANAALISSSSDDDELPKKLVSNTVHAAVSPSDNPGHAIPADGSWQPEDHQAQLVEISERGSVSSRGGGGVGAATEESDPAVSAVGKALGSQAAERYAFAAEIRSEEGVKDILVAVCDRVAELDRRLDELKRQRDVALRNDAVRQRRDGSRHSKSLLDNLKKESLALWAAANLTIEGSTKIGQLLQHFLVATHNGLHRTVVEIQSLKNAISGQNPKPLTIEAVGVHLDACLQHIQDVSSSAGPCSVGAASCCGSHIISTCGELTALTTVPALASQAANGQLCSPTRGSQESGTIVADALRRVTDAVAEMEQGLRQMKQSFETLGHEAEAISDVKLRSRLSQEELLRVYRDEVDETRRRLRVPTQETGIQCDNIGSSAPDGTISVPTTTSTTMPVSSGSRPGSAGGVSRPSSRGVRRGVQGASQVTPSATPTVVPTVIKHLIVCVNAMHIAFTELTFGPLHCISEFQSLAAQQQQFEARTRIIQHAEGLTQMDGIVVNDRGGKRVQRSAATWSQDPGLRNVIESHIRSLPGTYNDVLQRHRRFHEVTVLPQHLTRQDEDDLAHHIDLAQRLVEMGTLWHEALGNEVRVHHCSAYLQLVRTSKPLQAAFFFHDVKLAEAETTALRDNAPNFAEALRSVIWPSEHGSRSSETDKQRQRAMDIVNRFKLLSDAASSRATFNWKALLVLFKHERMKQLLLAAVKLSKPGSSGTSAEHLRQTISAFYTDMSMKFEAEKQLLRSSLKLTVDAIWSELISLLRQSAALCYANGINLDVLETRGASFAHILTDATRQLSEVLAARRNVRDKQQPIRISPPALTSLQVSNRLKPVEENGELDCATDAEMSSNTHCSEWMHKGSTGVGPADSRESSITAGQLLSAAVTRWNPLSQVGGQARTSSATSVRDASLWLGVPIAPSERSPGVIDESSCRKPHRGSFGHVMPAIDKSSTSQAGPPGKRALLPSSSGEHHVPLPRAVYPLSAVLSDGNPWMRH